MIKLDLARSKELLTFEFCMASFRTLRKRDLILYATVLWFRDKSALTNNTLP